MTKRPIWIVLALLAWPATRAIIVAQKKPVAAHTRNIVIFVSDGLRAGSVNTAEAPTYFWIREHGVSFPNSHSRTWFTTARNR